MSHEGKDGMLVVWVYGAPGVGKSTTSWQLYSTLSDSGVLCSYVDIDQIGMCFPAPSADRDRHRLKGRALAALLPNYAAAGAQVLVVSGVLDPTQMDWYQEVLAGAELAFCRLRVDETELRRRNAERGSAAQDWDSVRREARQLEAAQLTHPTVEANELTPAQVAAAVRKRLGRQISLSATPPVRRTDGRLVRESRVAGRVIWLCGPTAVGKSAVAWEVFRALLKGKAVTGYLDLQQLGFIGRPAAATTHALQAANVAAVWDCFGGAGASQLVLSGAVQTQAQLQLYRDAMQAGRLTVRRLRAGKETFAHRARARANGCGPRLAGDRLINQPDDVIDEAARRAWLEQQQLDLVAIGDVVLDTDGVTAADVAAEVLSLL